MDNNNGNVTICYPNRVEGSTLSGGDWSTQLPLNNLRQRVIKKRARSASTDLADTQFSVEWARPYPITMLAIAGHNFSTLAKIKIKVYDDSLMTTLLYDSGFVDVWPSIYESTDLEWEYDSFWLGTLAEEDRQQFTPLFVHFFNSGNVPIAKYLTVEIDDTLNSSGYVEAGRLFFGDAWQPTINASLGIQFQYQTSTEVEAAMDDTEYFDRRTPRRSVSFTLDRLALSEAFGRMFSIQRQQGIDGEVLFAYTKNDEMFSYERRFLGRLSQLDAIAEPYVDQRHSAPMSILEII